MSAPEIPPAYLEDASGYRGEAERLLIPASADAVASIIREATASRTPLTLAGAGTGVTGGRVPHGGWIVSLEKFQRLEIDGPIARAGAGVRLADLHAAARAAGHFFPPDPTEITASVGGIIATNASGSRSFRFGPVRRWVRALQVARMDGSVRWYRRGEKVDFPFTPTKPRNTTKHAAGLYLREAMDWVDLFAGSEGILGIILDAELGLLPLPAELLTGVAFFRSEDAALEAVDHWRAVAGLRMLEFFDPGSITLLRKKFPAIPAPAQAAVIVEDDTPDAIDAWVERLEARQALDDSWFGTEAQDRERFRAFRHSLPEIVNDFVRSRGFQKQGTDFAVPVDQNRTMMAEYRRGCDDFGPGRSVIFGHIGDAHVHVNLLPETDSDVLKAAQTIEHWARTAVRLGGTVSAEHGLGKKKAWMLTLEYDPDDIRCMGAVKAHLDPLQLLGQGTLLPRTG